MERLYWRDVDAYGLSTFGLQLLAFLTKEFISRGEYGQNALKVLHDWSNDSSNGEVSWKAARSYGVVLWCHNADLLGTEAEAWAKVKSRLSWRRAAELLDGAYEIALAGSQRLPQLPQIDSTDNTCSIFAAGVSTYVILTWSGRVRDVLAHLAASAEQLSHTRNLPRKTEKRREYRRQGELCLDAILEAFFLVTAASLTEMWDSQSLL